MRGKRFVVTVALSVLAAADLVGCGGPDSAKSESVPGFVVMSQCDATATTRELQKIDAVKGAVEWKRYFSVSETNGVNSIASCITSRTGAEQNYAFKDFYRQMLAVKDGEGIGWIQAVDTVNKAGSARFAPFFGPGSEPYSPGAYDASGPGMTYYASGSQMTAYDGMMGKSMDEPSSTSDSPVVYLPVGSHKPRFASGDFPASTAFKGDFGFAALHSGVVYGVSDEIFSAGDTKIATTTDGKPAPAPIAVLSKDRYVGYSNDGIFDVRVKGHNLVVKKLHDSKDPIQAAVAGPKGSVAFLTMSGVSEQRYTKADIYTLASGASAAHHVRTLTGDSVGNTTLLAFNTADEEQ